MDGRLVEPKAADLVCLADLIPVQPRPEGSRTWGRGEEDDPTKWIHKYSRNYLGNQDCGKRALVDEEVGPYSEAN